MRENNAELKECYNYTPHAPYLCVNGGAGERIHPTKIIKYTYNSIYLLSTVFHVVCLCLVKAILPRNNFF